MPVPRRPRATPGSEGEPAPSMANELPRTRRIGASKLLRLRVNPFETISPPPGLGTRVAPNRPSLGGKGEPGIAPAAPSSTGRPGGGVESQLSYPDPVLTQPVRHVLALTGSS